MNRDPAVWGRMASAAADPYRNPPALLPAPTNLDVKARDCSGADGTVCLDQVEP